MGVASLVLGIISIIFCWIPGLNWFFLIPTLVGLILGAVGISVNKKKRQKTFTKSGSKPAHTATYCALKPLTKSSITRSIPMMRNTTSKRG